MVCFIFITSRARIDLDHDFFDILTFGTAPTFKFVFFQKCKTPSTLSVQFLHSCFYFLCVRSLLPYGMWYNQSNIQVRIFAFACSQRSQPRFLKQIDIQKMYCIFSQRVIPLYRFRLSAIYIGCILLASTVLQYLLSLVRCLICLWYLIKAQQMFVLRLSRQSFC